jgi:flagellar biosynthesis protein FlhF
MLVDSRRAGVESRHLGQYEVICASIPPRTSGDEAKLAALAEKEASNAGFGAPGLDRLSQEVTDLRRHMEHLSSTIVRCGAGLATLRSDPALAQAFAILTAAEVDPALAQDILSRVSSASTPPEAGATTDNSELEAKRSAGIRSLLAVEVERLLSVDNRLGREKSPHRVVVLVGPPGSGKTTCIVKLAAKFGLSGRKPTQILTLDTFRVGAAEQLRAYATILGVGFQITETTLNLAQALEEHRQKELILIDTPGFSRSEVLDSQALGRFLGTHPDMDVHLVVPASMKSADLKRTIEQYGCYRPAKLLFSRVDETDTFGPILNQIVSSGKPVSFLSCGQQIPEDLEVATKSSLLELILKKEYLQTGKTSARAAA